MAGSLLHMKFIVPAIQNLNAPLVHIMDKKCSSVLLLTLYTVSSLCPDICTQSPVRTTQIGDGICTAQCNSPSCGFMEEGDCLEECIESGCPSDLLGDGKCDGECSSFACALDRGDCGYCSPGCYLYMLEDEVCQEACFVPECDFDRGKCEGCAPLCFADDVYASERAQVGNGSILSPYPLLSTAIEAATGHFTTIYLLGSRIPFSLPETIHFKLLITSLTCGERQSPFCSREVTSIDITTAGSFAVSAAVTFQRVVFTTVSVFERLEVKACPTLVMHEGTWVDENSHPASEDSIEAWNLCSAFRDIAVFVVSGESLTLLVMTIQSVNVTDLLVQQKAFIQIKAGTLILEEVHFEGVETLRGAGVGAVILLTGDCGSCELRYRRGSVQHLNSRLQYSPNAKGSPFLYAETFHSLEAAHISFKFNTVIDAYSNVLSPSVRALFYLGNFFQVNVSNCEFHSNFVSGGLIVIESSVQLSRDPDPQNIASQFLATHIDLRDISFRWNLGEHCMISITFTGDTLNVHLADVEFTDNAIEGENFLNFGNRVAATESLAFGAVEEVLASNGTKVSVWVPPRTIALHSVTIRNSYSFSTLIFIRNFANINISHLEISDSGDSEQAILSRTFASCCPEASIIPSFPLAPACFSLLWTDGCFFITIVSSAVERNECVQSAAFISATFSQGLVKVSDLTAQGNYGASDFGLVFDIEGNTEFEGDSLVFRNNTNAVGSAVFFYALAKVKLTHSLFEGNTGVYGGIFYFFSVQQAEFSDCIFKRTTAVDSMGGVAVWWVASYLTVGATIEHCVFDSNTAIHGGAVAFDMMNVTTVLLRVKRTSFVNNSADFFGSAIYVTPSLVFAEGSTIEDSTFQNNAAAYGTVWLKHTSTLRFSRCLFQGNYGSAAAVVLIETPPDAATVFEGVRFLHNYGSHTILKSNPRTNSTLISSGCTFSGNPAGSVAMEGGFWKDFSSTFTNSESSQLLLSYGAVAQLIDAVFSANTETRSGAAVHAMTGSVFKCFNCLFTNNSARQKGGAIFTEQEASVYIEDCWFVRNAAESGGGALSFASSQKTLSVVRSSVLQENDGGSLGVVFAQAAAFLLDNVTVRANTGEGCPGITLLMGHATIQHSVFQNMSGSIAAFLAMYTSSTASVSHTEFARGQVTNGGVIYLSSLSNLTISKTVFHEVSCARGGAVTALSSSRVSLSEVTMNGIESQGPGSLLYLSDSSLSISASEFSSFFNSGLFGYQLREVTITGSIFAYGEGLFGSAAYFVECGEVEIVDSTFTYLKAPLGGALHFEATAAKLPQVRIDDSRFMENEGNIGGAVYAINHDMAILNSFFTSNKAAEGGALYLDCSAKCAYSITESAFTLNSATARGGAVAWLMAQPTVANTTFENNAAPYGPDLASFPLFVRIDNITQTSIAPGQALNVSVLATLRDHYSQVVAIDSSSVAHLIPQFANATISGETKVTATEGHFVFGKFQVYAQPNSSIAVTVTSGTVQQAQEVVLSVRECRPGEFQTLDSCVMCSPGTFSFDPKSPCRTCPRNALCLGNSTVIPIRGFWRSGVYSPEMRECPNKDACLGGKADNGPLSLTGRCAVGYKGNLCQSCQDRYSRTGKNYCEKCPPRSLNITRLAGLSIVVAIAVSLVIWSAMRSAFQPAAIHSILIRILVNYLQLVVLVSEFKLNWPVPVIELFKSQENVGRVSEQLYSVDCFLADEKTNAESYYRKNIYMVMLPCGATGGAMLFWVMVAARMRSAKVMKRQCIATIVILFFLVLPNIVQAMFSMLSCVKIEDGQYWLTTMMDVPCWNLQHYRNLMTVALPGIAVWIIAVPLLCLLLLVKFRRRHDEIWLRVQFGFITNGYLRKCYYWEFVILYRKVLIICISAFISTSIPVQALTVQFVLLLALFLQYKTRPFKSDLLNSVELRSLLVADVTVFCGLYFLTNDIPAVAQWFFFTLIVASNAIFLVYWVTGMLGHVIHILAHRFRLIKRVVSPGRTVDEEVEKLIALMTPVAISKLAIADRNMCDCYREMLMVGISVGKFRSRKYRMWPFYASSYDIST